MFLVFFGFFPLRIYSSKTRFHSYYPEIFFGVFLRLFRFVLVSNSTILSSDSRERLGCRAAGWKQGCNFIFGNNQSKRWYINCLYLPNTLYSKRREELPGGLLANQKRRIILKIIYNETLIFLLSIP